MLVCKDTNTGNNGHKIQLNNDTGSNYPLVYAGDNGSTGSASSAYTSDGFDTQYFGTANAPNITIFNLMDYSVTDKHKTAIYRNSATFGYGVSMYAARWANTSAVTSLKILANAGLIASGSTFALYGIAA